MSKPERQYKVGDRVQVTLHIDAVVKAVVHRTDGTQLPVDYERDQRALAPLDLHAKLEMAEAAVQTSTLIVATSSKNKPARA